MNQSVRRRCLCAIQALAFLAACSSDPARQRIAFIASGQEYVKQGKYSEAVIQFRNAIEVDPRSAEAHRNLALVFISQKDYQQAFRELMRTVELDSKDVDARLQLAALLVGGRKYEEAQSAAEKVIASDPRNARAHAVLGDKHSAVGTWPLAIQEFANAIELDPAQPKYYAGLALAYASSNRVVEAEATLKTAVQRLPEALEARLNLGRFYIAQQRLTEAEATVRAAAGAHPSEIVPLMLMAKIYTDGGKVGEVETVYGELKRRARNNPDAYGALATLYEIAGQKEKAAAEWHALMVARPKDSSVKSHLTEILLDLNRVEEAARLNHELLASRPGDPRVLLSKGRILVAQQKYTDAKATLEAAGAADPQSAAAHYFRGLAELGLGLSGLARASFARTLQLSPDMVDAMLALGDLDLHGADYDGALIWAKRALQKKPDLTTARVITARALAAKGNASAAEVELRVVLDQQPLNLPALGALLNIQASQGGIQEMAQRLSTLIGQHPREARLHLLLGIAYLKQNDLDRAEVTVHRAMAMDPKTPDAASVLAEISIARGAWDRAIAAYKRAIEENPKKAETYMALSGLYRRQGKGEEAKRVAERAHLLDPGSPFIANNLAFLYLEHGGDFNVALSLAQQARQKLPDSPVVLDTIGWAYYKLGSSEAAVGHLSESVRRAPENPVYHYHLGMAYADAGRFDQAARALQQALSSRTDFPYAASAKTALQDLARRSR